MKPETALSAHGSGKNQTTKALVFGANPVATQAQERIWVGPANKGSNLTRYQASIMQEIDDGAA